MTPLSPGAIALLREPSYAHLATVMPNGSPQLTQVWVDTDGDHILINTAAARQKTRNVQRDPRVAVWVVDPTNPYRYLSVRGVVVAIRSAGADEQLDALAQRYLGQPTYPWRRPDEQRAILVIAPETVRESGL
ncbi:MAG: PPOX class F420-dependent oxidoreductase [Dehalococcoidia bacterium]|nr:PPOX class F420-dependent oxidoreductase [Dehalococcoidia bacterium]